MKKMLEMKSSRGEKGHYFVKTNKEMYIGIVYITIYSRLCLNS